MGNLNRKCGRNKGCIPWNKGLKTGYKPKTVFANGHMPWNKGLTKETDNRVKLVGEKIVRVCNNRPSKKKKYMMSLTVEERSQKYGSAGSKNPMYGKPAPKGSGRCKWIKYNGILLQGSYELRFAKWLDKMNMKWERPNKMIPYIKNGKHRSYLPDFKVWFDNKPDFVDTKGYFDKEGQEKIKLVREQHPEDKFIIVDKQLLKAYENLSKK